MKLRFYDVDERYADYLRRFDKKIPNIKYSNRNKFLCGVVLTVNGQNYYVPVSSNKKNYFTSFLLRDEHGGVLSSLRFSFMFPCPVEAISLKNINSDPDPFHRILTNKEYSYCNKHETDIRSLANKIYKLSLNEKLRSKYNICDFKLLEKKCNEYTQAREQTSPQKKFASLSDSLASAQNRADKHNESVEDMWRHCHKGDDPR